MKPRQIDSHMLAACEQRAIQLYYASLSENRTKGWADELFAAGDRRAMQLYYHYYDAAQSLNLTKGWADELLEEFGEECVSEMLVKGIGNNCAANRVINLIGHYVYIKGFPLEKVISSLEKGFIDAFSEIVPLGIFQRLRVNIDNTNGKVRIFSKFSVVTDEDYKNDIIHKFTNISISDALKNNSSAKIGDILELEKTPTDFETIGLETATFSMIKNLHYPECGDISYHFWKNEENYKYVDEDTNYVDIHGLSLLECKIIINVSLEYAKTIGWQKIILIHGHHGGTKLRTYIWESIEKNIWSSVIGKSPIDNLLKYLNKYNFDNLRHRNSTMVKLDYFVFRSGSTRMPIISTYSGSGIIF